MNWKIKITDPSGETRWYTLPASATLGRSPTCDLPLRDSSVAERYGRIWTRPAALDRSPYWLRTEADEDRFRVGDLEAREAQLPAGVPFLVGDTHLEIIQEQVGPGLPELPAGTRPWLTACESGARALWLTRKAAATPLSIYLAGETGTGKEVLAHLVHAWSERAGGPFVPLHCGALSVSLAESELFGHVKGAFTGASHQRPGALMQAHGGTLFLDEVGDLPLDIQVKLLRFLENGEIRAVGADRVTRADTRLVCATHHPLARLVAEGRFRRDLFYRLASVTVEIPTLRARPADIDLLGARFAADLKRRLSPMARRRLRAHAWPGNVRELRHAIERACGLAGPFTTLLGEGDFDFLAIEVDRDAGGAAHPAEEAGLGAPVLKLGEMERLMVLRALRVARGNRAEAARALGIARSTLFEMMRRQRIAGPNAQATELLEAYGPLPTSS